jgi:hypothetical protein
MELVGEGGRGLGMAVRERERERERQEERQTDRGRDNRNVISCHPPKRVEWSEFVVGAPLLIDGRCIVVCCGVGGSGVDSVVSPLSPNFSDALLRGTSSRATYPPAAALSSSLTLP